MGKMPIVFTGIKLNGQVTHPPVYSGVKVTGKPTNPLVRVIPPSGTSNAKVQFSDVLTTVYGAATGTGPKLQVPIEIPTVPIEPTFGNSFYWAIAGIAIVTGGVIFVATRKGKRNGKKTRSRRSR